MPKYKRLHNIARNFAHSFMRQMNTVDTDYVCDLLVGEMYRHDVDEIVIDIFTTDLQPPLISQTLVLERLSNIGEVNDCEPIGKRYFEKV